MSNSIAFFRYSTEEDFSYVLEFTGLDLTDRAFEVKIKDRASNTVRRTLTLGAGLTVVGTAEISAAVAKADMASWPTGEYSADVVDVTDGAHSRIMAVRFVYDLPGLLVDGVSDRKAFVTWTANRAYVTATGAVGPNGPPGPTGPQGVGWSPVFAAVSDGARRVFQVTDWVGGTGDKPSTGDYVGATGLVAAIEDAADFRGAAGADSEVEGPPGAKGWSPTVAMIEDGERRVLEVVDWVGGEGSEPASGLYIGPSGLVADIADATDFRGPEGPPGTAAIDDGSVTNAKLADMATARFKGRTSDGDGPPEDMTPAQSTALLSAFTGDSGSGGSKGLVPAPASGDAASGKLLGAGGSWVAPPYQPAGQCILLKSGSDVVLLPLAGNLLTIGGINRAIPSGGVSLSVTGLTPSTRYYIYASWVAGAIVLEPSTTGHSTDTSTGVEIKTGDPDKTLVGMLYPITGPAFADTSAQRLVISWFNQGPIFGTGRFSTIRTSGATSYAEINAEIRVQFLTWAGRSTSFAITGGSYNSGANQTLTSVGIDSTTTPQDVASFGSGINAQPVGLFHATTLSEGFHYATVLGRVSAGTGSWYTNTDNPGERFTLKVLTSG